jgi:hypothetical protein
VAQARRLPLSGCHGRKTWLMASGQFALFCRKYSLRMTHWVYGKEVNRFAAAHANAR